MSKFKKFPVNDLGRDFVCGDIHGCFDQLRQLLADVTFNTSIDRLFCVGDLIDRGPHSIQAVRYLRDEPWFNCIMGNHEMLLCNTLDEPITPWGTRYWGQIWDKNGGEWRENVCFDQLAELQNLVAILPIMAEVELLNGTTVGLIHSKCPTLDWNVAKQEFSQLDQRYKLSCLEHFSTKEIIQQAVWQRKRPTDACNTVMNINHVYVGHTVLTEITTDGNITWLDTGAGYPTGKLSLLQLQ